MNEALVFTRTKHRANRVWEYLTKHGIAAARIHGNRSQAQRTDALGGFKDGRYRVLVATDIAARGIDVEALGHVVNFDVPAAPEDYIHRVGRTARAEMTGEAFTFYSPAESDDLRAIERAIGKALPRVTLPDFDYDAKPATKLEIPIAERLAKHRAQRNAGRSAQRGGDRSVERKVERSGEHNAGAERPAGRTSAKPRQNASPYRDATSTASAADSGQRRRRRRRGGRGRGAGGAAT